jgi:hypothetical protein
LFLVPQQTFVEALTEIEAKKALAHEWIDWVLKNLFCFSKMLTRIFWLL